MDAHEQMAQILSLVDYPEKMDKCECSGHEHCVDCETASTDDPPCDCAGCYSCYL